MESLADSGGTDTSTAKARMSQVKPAGDEFSLVSQHEQLMSYKSVPAVLTPLDGYPVGRLYLEKTKEKITC